MKYYYDSTSPQPAQKSSQALRKFYGGEADEATQQSLKGQKA